MDAHNWHDDVVALLTDAAEMVATDTHSAYGVARGAGAGDANGDFALDSTDKTN